MEGGNPAERPVELRNAVERAGIADALTGSGAGLLYGPSRLSGGAKVDVIVVSGDAFEQAKFGRRRRVRWMGSSVWAVTAAEPVIRKLRWAKESVSARQLADVRAIMAAGQVAEDDEFRHWIDTLGLQQALDASREARYDA
ncbi:MAG: hypothetical protein Kow0010_14280 [Dehalococcoidia bacterium]